MPVFIKPINATAGTNGFSPTHTGVDFPVPVGTPVYASASGKVTLAGLDGPRGNTIEIDHGNGHSTFYSHLSGFQVSKGAQVTQGQLIGYSGGARGAAGAGISTGPHLHAGHKIAGIPVDPVPFWSGTAIGTGSGTGNADKDGYGGATVTAWGRINPDKPAATLLEIFTSAPNWQRIGYFVLGGTLLLIVLVKFLSSTDVGKAAVSSVKTTANTAKKVAAVAVTKNPAAAAA